MNKNFKKRIKPIIKFFIGLAILVFLFSKTNVQSFVSDLKNADYIFFIVAIISYVIGQVISAKKWMIISEKLNFRNSFSKYLSWYFLGMFYNTFLPTNIGGDVIKVVKMKKTQPRSMKNAIISVLADRITGMLVLVSFLFFGLFYYHSNIIINVVSVGIILSSSLAVLVLIFLINNMKIIPENFRSIFDVILLLCNKKPMIKILAISFIFHLFLILIHYCIGKMYGMSIPVMYYCLLYPITAIIASLPFSINGMGLKEAVYVYMLKLFNIDISSALLFAITFNMVVLFSNTMGFIPYMAEDKRQQRQSTGEINE